MGEQTEISWVDATFNGWMGCQKVSAGCVNCYAEELMDRRHGKVKWGPQGTRLRTSESYWKQPLRWNKQKWSQCQSCGWRGSLKDITFNYDAGRFACPTCASLDVNATRMRVFCASLADVFEDRAELIPWRGDLFTLIHETPNLDWLLLTKRPEGWEDRLHEVVRENADGGDMLASHWLDGEAPANVWMGTSVEDQKAADERIPALREIPAKVHFLSMEPLLGPVDFSQVPGFNRIGLNLYGWWVIVGGESGKKARSMNPEWVRAIRDQCKNAGVPFHFKQWGEWRPFDTKVDPSLHMESPVEHLAKMNWAHGTYRVGKRAAGRMLDGIMHNDWPAVSR